jgi:TP901 family phage tail tape measure protein
MQRVKGFELILDARRAKQGAKEFEASVRGVSAGAKRADKDLNRLDKRMHSVGKTAGSTKKMMVGLFGGLAATAAIRTTLKTIIQFEDTMQTVRAVTKASDDEMKRLTATARIMGATTRYSASQAGEGLVFLARAGFTANQAIEALPHTLSLAAAGAIELGEAADFASNIMSAFRLETKEMERVVDVLVNTANSANTDVRQLAEAMKYSAPVAGALGISIEQTAAAIGVMGDAGIQGSMAGTSMRGVLAALVGPTDQAKKALKQMGLTAHEVNPEYNDLTEVFEKFRAANMGAAEANAIFGRRNISAALVIASSTEKLRELTRANEEAERAARDAAKTMSDDLEGALKSLGSVVSELMLQTGDSGLGESLRSTIDLMTDTLRVLAGMEIEYEKNAEMAEFLAAAITGIGGAIAVFAAYKTAVLAAKLAMMAFNAVVAMNPIGLIGTALAVVIGTLYTFRDTTLEIKGTTAEVTEWIAAAWDVTTQRLIYQFRLYAHAFKISWKIMLGENDESLQKLDKQWNSYQKHWLGNWSTSWGKFGKTVKEAVNLIIGVFLGFADTIGKIVLWLIEDLGNLFATFKAFDKERPLQSMDEVLKQIDRLEVRDWGKIKEDLKSTWQYWLTEDHIQRWYDKLNKAGEESGKIIVNSFKSTLTSEEAKEYERIMEQGFIDAIADKAGELARRRRDIAAQTAMEAIGQGGGGISAPAEYTGDPELFFNYESMVAAVTHSTEVLSEAEVNARLAIDKMLKSLEMEKETLNMTAEERRIYTDVLKLETLASDARLHNGEQVIETYEKEARAIFAAKEELKKKQELETKREQAAERLIDMNKAIEDQTRLVGLNAQAREYMTGLIEIERMHEQGLIGDLGKATDEYNRRMTALQDAKEEAGEYEDKEGTGAVIGKGLGGGMKDAFREALQDGEMDFANIGRRMGENIVFGIMDNLILDPITESLSNALTGVLDSFIEGISEGLTSAVTESLAEGTIEGVSGGMTEGAVAGGTQAAVSAAPAAAGAAAQGAAGAAQGGAAATMMSAATIMVGAATTQTGAAGTAVTGAAQIVIGAAQIFTVGPMLTTAGSVMAGAGAMMQGAGAEMLAAASMIMEAATVEAATPFFAEGGLVTRPTKAVIGESGPELIIPLNKLDRFALGGSVMQAGRSWLDSGGWDKLIGLFAPAEPVRAEKDFYNIRPQLTGAKFYGGEGADKHFSLMRNLFPSTSSNPALYGNRWASSGLGMIDQLMDDVFGRPSTAGLSEGKLLSGGILSLLYAIFKSQAGSLSDLFDMPGTYDPFMIRRSGDNPLGNYYTGFASGGIVDKPTIFRHGGDRMGLMGEAGPEVIMPLKRGADGELGVSGEGGRTVNITMNIIAKDADSFRKSQRQIAADMRRQIGA